MPVGGGTRRASGLRNAPDSSGRCMARCSREGVVRDDDGFDPRVLFYNGIPPADVSVQFLEPSPHTSFCEYKGQAHYYSLVIDGEKRSNVAWYYPNPSPGYEDLADHIAFYAWALDEATVDGEQVTPQPGHFYGGWITSEITGPIKGKPGTTGW